MINVNNLVAAIFKTTICIYNYVNNIRIIIVNTDFTCSLLQLLATVGC